MFEYFRGHLYQYHCIMRFPCLVAFLLIILPFFTHAQDLQFDWVRTTAGTLSDYSIANGSDGAGNVYTVGTFSGTADIDAGPGVYTMTSQGSSDIYIAKHNANGQLIWARQIGNDHGQNEGLRKMITDIAGNIFITGSFYGTLDFDPGPGVSNLVCTGLGYAAYLLKLDANGNFVWAKNIAQSDYGNIGYDVTQAVSGNVYVLGTFKGLTDFDPGPGTFMINSTNTGQDIFISKFDAVGNYIWTKRFTGTQGQVGYSIRTDVLENVYTTGLFYGVSDFDPGPAVYNLTANSTITGSWADAYVSKMDANGNLVWARQFDGAFGQEGFSLTVDPAGDIVITGVFAGNTDFDPGPGTFILNTSNQDIRSFIVKLDPGGILKWASQFGGTNAVVHARSVACDAQGNIYLTGMFINSADFDPGSTVFELNSQGSSNIIFIAKLKPDGSFAFAKQLATSSYSLAFCITVDAAKNVYVSGYFGGVQDFDPEAGVHFIGAKGSVDGFLLKLNQCVQSSSESLNITACTQYILNNQTYTSSGIYTQHLQNVAGCDSALTLHLTIGGSINTSNVTACGSYSWEGQTYTANGNYTVTYTGASGCDSIRKLNLTLGQHILSTIDRSICQGENYQGYTNSGTYTDIFVAANGCDSTRTLHLSVKPTPQQTFNVAICEGETYWNHFASGIYRDTLAAVNGCDSIRILQLLVNPVKRTSANISICKGENYFAGGASQINSGVYRDTLIARSGCDSIITTTLTVNDLPVPNLGADRDLCTGTTLPLNPGTFSNYVWHNQSTNASMIASTAGVYWVRVTDINGCKATDTLVIATLLPSPANFLNPVDSICQYEKLQLKPIGNYNNYTWSNGSNQSILMVQTPGQYILEVQDQNGCNGRDTIQVYSKTCRTGVFIPTAFTPNGDGKNDEFKAFAFGNFIAFKLDVYNRWGELIFSTSDPSKGWNGKLKGVTLATDVFVWRCTYQLAGERIADEKGTVTLIR